MIAEPVAVEQPVAFPDAAAPLPVHPTRELVTFEPTPPAEPKTSARRFPAAVLLLTACAIIGYLIYPKATPPRSADPQSVQAPKPQAKSAPQAPSTQQAEPSATPAAVQKPTITETTTTLDAGAQWRRFAMEVDPDRPVITLNSTEPFRLRVNGRLYLVAPGAPTSVDFGNARSFELKAVSRPTTIIQRRSPVTGGATP